LNIIAVETSTDICGIALIKNGKCVDLVEKRIPRKHAEQLPVFYDTLIKSSNFNEFKINAVAVSIGPGSFTGLRVGLGFSKGLAYAKNLPIIPVPTLDALGKISKLINEYSVLLYSHRDIVYTQAFKKNKTFKKPKAVQWEKIDHSKLIFHYGCEKLIRDEKHETLIPSAKNIGELAANNYEDWLIERPYDLVPNYISPFEL
jgi:tRNA threonylcarbamoyl adenosine modification protein YeaZ